MKTLANAYSALMHKFRPRKLTKWRSAGILLTYRCNAACAHCYENSGPRKRALMPVEHLRKLLREFKKLGFTGRDLHLVSFRGRNLCISEEYALARVFSTSQTSNGERRAPDPARRTTRSVAECHLEECPVNIVV